MKKALFILFTVVTFIACKNNNNNQVTETNEFSIAQKIADAHGFEHWNNVKSFAFTFGGKIDDSQSGRSWVWYPKTNQITLKNGDETIVYNRNELDSTSIKTDKAFINDKFCALIPFQVLNLP